MQRLPPLSRHLWWQGKQSPTSASVASTTTSPAVIAAIATVAATTSGVAAAALAAALPTRSPCPYATSAASASVTAAAATILATTSAALITTVTPARHLCTTASEPVPGRHVRWHARRVARRVKQAGCCWWWLCGACAVRDGLRLRC